MISYVFTEYIDVERGKSILDGLQNESPNCMSIRFLENHSETVSLLTEYAKMLWPIDGQLSIV